MAVSPITDQEVDTNASVTISVIVPTFKRPLELERCLQAVVTQSYPSFDIIVVDNSPGDELTLAVARKFSARYVCEPRRGLCKARNRGALVSSATIVAYLDDDAIPDRDWLSGFAKMFENESVMGVAGRTIPLALDTESEKLFAQVRGAAYDRPAPIVVDKNTPDWFDIAGFGGIGPGCNMALRRSAFERWPGFHEGTDRGTPVYGGGEQHAFYSLVDFGFAVAYTPDAVVKHPLPQSMEALRSRYLRDLTASTAYFTMMLVEEPKHRGSTLRYLWESIRKKPRTWRATPQKRPRVVPVYRSAAALVMGPFKYFQGAMRAGK